MPYPEWADFGWCLAWGAVIIQCCYAAECSYLSAAVASGLTPTMSSRRRADRRFGSQKGSLRFSFATLADESPAGSLDLAGRAVRTSQRKRLWDGHFGGRALMVNDDHSMALVCLHVLRGERDVLLVYREDGLMTFLCGQTDHEQSSADFKVAGVSHLIERDSTLAEVANVPEGLDFERTSRGSRWRSAPDPYDQPGESEGEGQDFRFLTPDAIVGWSEAEVRSRVEAMEPFLVVDGRDFHVRVLLPVRLVDDSELAFSVWMQIDIDAMRHAAQCWDSDSYLDLQLHGRLANLLPPWPELALGVSMSASPRSHEEGPYVTSSDDQMLAAILNDKWDRTIIRW